MQLTDMLEAEKIATAGEPPAPVLSEAMAGIVAKAVEAAEDGPGMEAGMRRRLRWIDGQAPKNAGGGYIPISASVTLASCPIGLRHRECSGLGSCVEGYALTLRRPLHPLPHRCWSPQKLLEPGGAGAAAPASHVPHHKKHCVTLTIAPASKPDLYRRLSPALKMLRREASVKLIRPTRRRC